MLLTALRQALTIVGNNMTPYQAFLSYPKKFYDWAIFVDDLPEILLSDGNFKKLLEKYPFFNDSLDEIAVIITDEIHEEFEYLGYSPFKEDYTDDSFYDQAYEILLFIILSKYVIPDRLLPDSF